MQDFGFNPGTVSAIGSVSVLVAFIGLLYQVRLNRRARYLQAALTISGRFRERWEGGWESLIRGKVPYLNLEDRHKGEVGRQLRYMLNWLDWMGLLLRKKWIHKDILFGSLESSIGQLLKQSAHQIQSDMEDPEKGKNWWANVLFIAEQREINVNIEEEAKKLRKKWGAYSKPKGGIMQGWGFNLSTVSAMGGAAALVVCTGLLIGHYSKQQGPVGWSRYLRSLSRLGHP